MKNPICSHPVSRRTPPSPSTADDTDDDIRCYGVRHVCDSDGISVPGSAQRQSIPDGKARSAVGINQRTEKGKPCVSMPCVHGKSATFYCIPSWQQKSSKFEERSVCLCAS